MWGTLFFVDLRCIEAVWVTKYTYKKLYVAIKRISKRILKNNNINFNPN